MLKICYFFDIVYGIINSFLKVVSLDIKEVLFLVGVKLFGLIFEFIFVLLWRKLEELGYIFEMNEIFKILIDFFKEVFNDVGLCCKFIRGEVILFNIIINEDDRVIVYFVSEDIEVDEIFFFFL